MPQREEGVVDRIVVVQDASTRVRLEAVRWALMNLQLGPGDMIRLFRVVQPFMVDPPINSGCGMCFLNPSTSISNQKGGNGINPSGTILKRQESIEREIIEKQEESRTNLEIEHILRLAESKQIDFDTSAEAGNSLKQFTVQAARDFGATYVILDSHMKKDQKYIVEQLTCAILMMRGNGQVEFLRDPKPRVVYSPRNIGTSTDAECIKEMSYDDNACTICGHKRITNGLFSRFSYAELAFSTYGFSQKYLLSKRRKRVYKGTLRCGLKIVIRKHFFATIKEEDFHTLAFALSKARHEHVATLLGFCLEGFHRFLVYESIANFGLTKNPYEDLNHLSEARVMKTFEYLAPEYDETGADSSKTDVYSFGVVLLELLTGRKTLEETNGKSFLRWARPLLEEKMYEDLVDPSMKDDIHLYQLVLIVRVVEDCLSYDPRLRCSISEVVTTLTQIVEIKDPSPIQ
ncbi:putative receptor-like protein kinase At4g00960 [Cynara cardunculus var. scolymus]|uniref:putative receptor-like protein kinase At4g00960 n=1 Tax=Cynara cardunculus var. scolymus TaxID=59895 RepID=UPI000D62456A|nr:putative receptor-like protein kinase At4g00960 [Cynara cardunculus var. scolymus]